MTLEEFQELTKNLLENNENVGILSESLVKLRDVFSEQNSELENLKNKFEKLEKENINLRETNMQLYLKTGVEKNGENKKNEESEESEESEEVLNFENFVDENGNLK